METFYNMGIDIGIGNGIFVVDYGVNASGYTVSGDNPQEISLTGILPLQTSLTPCKWNLSVLENILHGSRQSSNINFEEGISGEPLCNKIYYRMTAQFVIEGSPGNIKKKLIKNGFSDTDDNMNIVSPPVISSGSIQLQSTKNMEISFCGELKRPPFILNGNSDISYIQDLSYLGFNPHILAWINTGIWNKIDYNQNYSNLILFWWDDATNYNKIINAFPRHDPLKHIYKFNLKLAE